MCVVVVLNVLGIEAVRSIYCVAQVIRKEMYVHEVKDTMTMMRVGEEKHKTGDRTGWFL